LPEGRICLGTGSEMRGKSLLNSLLNIAAGIVTPHMAPKLRIYDQVAVEVALSSSVSSA